MGAGTFPPRRHPMHAAPMMVPSKPGVDPMISKCFFPLAAAAAVATPAAAADAPPDPQIAHIAYTAGTIDIAAGKQALARSHNRAVRSFAQQMVRDHQAVNVK